MKWEKFEAFAATHLELGPCLHEQIGFQLMPFTLQEWVEKQVKYIAVSPWDRLDMNAASHIRPLTQVQYTLWHHIVGEERAYSRAVTSTNSQPFRTPAQLIADTAEWHGEYWAKQANRPLAFDAIVRSEHTARTYRSYSEQALNIYLVPDNFHS